MDCDNIAFTNATPAEVVCNPPARPIQLFIRPDTVAIDDRVMLRYPLRLFGESLVNWFVPRPTEPLGRIWQNRSCGWREKGVILYRRVRILGDVREQETELSQHLRRPGLARS